MEAKRATLRDVAAAAGVSRALAGFVLGDDHGRSIPEATRERVAALGYEVTLARLPGDDGDGTRAA